MLTRIARWWLRSRGYQVANNKRGRIVYPGDCYISAGKWTLDATDGEPINRLIISGGNVGSPQFGLGLTGKENPPRHQSDGAAP